MSRFDSSDWCDFVRGVADADLDGEIRRQLAAGSDRPRREEQRWRRVAELGRKDARRPVPGHAVRVAKAVGSLHRGAGQRPAAQAWQRLPFEILFDSLAEPAAAGTRGPGVPGRHLAVEAGSYTVDVRFQSSPEPQPAARRGSFRAASLDGQILHKNGEKKPLPSTPVLVTSGDRIVRSMVSDRTGEFHAEGLPHEPLSLCLLVGGGRCIEVPLELG